MKTEVQVTQECIDKGVAEDRRQCPIARALMPLVADGIGVQVDKERMGFDDGEHVWSVGTPKECDWFIEDFDYGEPVAPFSFTLDVPDDVLKAKEAK
jgi:hypothetical protein